MSTEVIAFIGGGNMARALIGGLLRQGQTAAAIRVGEPDSTARARLTADFAVSALADNRAAADGAALLVLAVKPQELRPVLTALASQRAAAAPPLLISIAAGIGTRDIGRWFPGAAVVRAMPNRAALLGAGISGLYAPPTTPAAARGSAERLLAAVGRCVWVPQESQLDVVTAVSGSGPAYFFLLAEQLAAAGRELGLESGIAQQLAVETLFGAGQLAHQDGDLAAQRAAVTSKGGTTAAALATLTAGGFEPLVRRAVAAAAQRAAELSAESQARS